MRFRRLMLPAAMGVAALVLASCGDVSLTSAYRSQPITVDGKYDDWKGNLKFIEKINMSVGAMNDDTNLYAILVIGDRETRQQVTVDGLFLWFDPAGKDDRQFGIHYPMGIPERAAGDVNEARAARREVAERDAMVAQSLEEAELIGVGGGRRIASAIEDLPGVEVSARQERGGLVIEYRIPLVADVNNPYGIGAIPGQEVGVGLLTTKREQPRTGEGMSGGRRPPGADGDDDGERGERGERPDGTGGRGGMRPARGAAEPPDPINLWVRLQLAARPD